MNKAKFYKGTLRSEDYHKILEYNELDLLRYMIAHLKECEAIAEKMLRGGKKSRMDMRNKMLDNINLSHVMRDMVAMRMGNITSNESLDFLLEREREYAKKIDANTMHMEADDMLQKIIQVRLAEQNRRKEREQKRQEERGGASGGEHQEAPDKL